MQPSAAPLPEASPPRRLVADDERTASWLHTPYSGAAWTVSDTNDPERRLVIDYRYPLADGTLLLDAPSFGNAVKEYAYWLRSPIFGYIDDAHTHYSYVRGLMHVAHALSLRGVSSFAAVSPYDIEQLVEACRFGIDSLLEASGRIQRYFASLRADDLRPPRHRILQTGRLTRYISASEVLAACNLPDSALKRNPRATWAIGKGALAAGLSLPHSRAADAPEIPPLLALTSLGLTRYLEPIQSLYTMRRKLVADGIPFRPFPLGAQRFAMQLGVPVERTPTAPPRLAFHLLTQAAHWIVDYSPPLLTALSEMHVAMREGGQRTQTFDAIASGLPRSGPSGSPWPLSLRGRQRADGFVFNEAIRLLAVACFVVIATFTARRCEEILELTGDSLRGDDEGGWWVHVYIEKTLQRKDWIPIPHLAARAIAILTELSAEARRQSGTASIFQWLTPFTANDGGAIYRLEPHTLLDDFAVHVGVPPSSDGPWHWSPHQFRRFFAILYYYRYEGDIEALAHHLRHFSLEMTRRYITEDPEVAALWSDVEWGYMGDLARSIVAGDRAIGGGMGRRLLRVANRIVSTLRRRLQVVEPARAGATLTLLMRRKGLVLSPKPWVICSCPRTATAASRARCREGTPVTATQIGPAFERAGPSVCPNCPWSVISHERVAFVDSELRHLDLVATSKPRSSTLFGELEAARLVTLSEVRMRAYEGASVCDPDGKRLKGAP